jgi:hypothetical protein
MRYATTAAIAARLERQELLDTEWGTSDNNRQARFYSLRPRGESG